MVNGKRVRGILVLALVFGAAAFGFSFDVRSFPSPIRKGSVLISGGFGIGAFTSGISYTDYSALMGGTVAVDYALPINFALTVGGETGYYGSRLKTVTDYDPDVSVGEIPIIARVAWHPNWEVRNLDTYVLLKIGYGIGFWFGDDVGDAIKNFHGLIFGSNIGVRYFFTPIIGVFAEGGYEFQYLTYKVEAGGFSEKWRAAGVKFLTLGVSFKL